MKAGVSQERPSFAKNSGFLCTLLRPNDQNSPAELIKFGFCTFYLLYDMSESYDIKNFF